MHKFAPGSCLPPPHNCDGPGGILKWPDGGKEEGSKLLGWVGGSGWWRRNPSFLHLAITRRVAAWDPGLHLAASQTESCPWPWPAESQLINANVVGWLLTGEFCLACTSGKGSVLWHRCQLAIRLGANDSPPSLPSLFFLSQGLTM
jgi:hypothetical protein